LLFIALDGVVEPDEEWHFPYVGTWPDRETTGREDAEFAKLIGDMRKVGPGQDRLAR
jgi:hypothetical protein